MKEKLGWNYCNDCGEFWGLGKKGGLDQWESGIFFTLWFLFLTLGEEKKNKGRKRRRRKGRKEDEEKKKKKKEEEEEKEEEEYNMYS